MRIAAIAVSALVAVAVVTAVSARADPSGDPRAEVEQLQQQTSELHAAWDSLSPAQRQQQLAQLQRQAVVVQNDVQNLPPDQRPEVQARLGVVTLELADILRKVWPTP
jgi:hypothetical protein